MRRGSPLGGYFHGPVGVVVGVVTAIVEPLSVFLFHSPGSSSNPLLHGDVCHRVYTLLQAVGQVWW